MLLKAVLNERHFIEFALNPSNTEADSDADDLYFINSRVCGSGFDDGQRSSLINLQSVSEAPISILTLNICAGLTRISIDFQLNID